MVGSNRWHRRGGVWLWGQFIFARLTASFYIILDICIINSLSFAENLSNNLIVGMAGLIFGGFFAKFWRDVVGWVGRRKRVYWPRKEELANFNVLWLKDVNVEFLIDIFGSLWHLSQEINILKLVKKGEKIHSFLVIKWKACFGIFWRLWNSYFSCFQKI